MHIIKTLAAKIAALFRPTATEAENKPPVESVPVPDYLFEPRTIHLWRQMISVPLDEFTSAFGAGPGMALVCALVDHLHARGYEFSLIGSKDLFQEAFRQNAREAYAFLRCLRGVGVECHLAWFVDLGTPPQMLLAYRLKRYSAESFAGVITCDTALHALPSGTNRVFTWVHENNHLRVPELGIDIDTAVCNHIADSDFGQQFFNFARSQD